MKLKKARDLNKAEYPTYEQYQKTRKLILKSLAVCTAFIGLSSTTVLSENNRDPGQGAEPVPTLHRLMGEIAVVENTATPTPAPTLNPEILPLKGVIAPTEPFKPKHNKSEDHED